VNGKNVFTILAHSLAYGECQHDKAHVVLHAIYSTYVCSIQKMLCAARMPQHCATCTSSKEKNHCAAFSGHTH